MFIDEILKKATTRILSEYERGIIVSERHLQAILYNGTIQQLNSRDIILLIEPKIQTNEACKITGLIPDMLLVLDNEIRGVIEIKYVPYNFVPYEKDFQTFRAFDSLRGNDSIKVYLKVIADNGHWDKSSTYSISSDLKFYYIAIGNYESNIITDTMNLVAKNSLQKFPGFLYTYFILVNNKDNSRQIQFGCY